MWTSARTSIAALIMAVVAGCSFSPDDDGTTADEGALTASPFTAGSQAITTAKLNVRKEPSDTAAIVRVLPKGTTVTIVDGNAIQAEVRNPAGGGTITVDFYRVKLADGLQGYCQSGWLAPATGAATASASPALVDEIRNVARQSSCASVKWDGRGAAPIGYIEGVALMYAHAVCNSTRSDIAVVGAPKTSDGAKDALAWYDSQFAELGLSNDTAGLSTVRNVYALLLGLGMRESSGKHCEGRDTSASNNSSDTCEAGAWQTSYNSHALSPELPKLFDTYQAGAPCHLDVFKQGVQCSSASWENAGDGDGATFQKLSKECPAFAAEYAAVMLRVAGGSKGHYGPLRRHEAEITTECVGMFEKIEASVKGNANICASLAAAP